MALCGDLCSKYFHPKVYLHYFFQFFVFFLLNDSPSKLIKNDFYFIQKALFVLEIFNLFVTFSLSFLNGIIYDAMNWLA